MYPYNPRSFQGREAITVPLQGGLDLVSPKAGGTPSTLAECYNYETADYPGYKQARGIIAYDGKLTKLPTTIYKGVDLGAAISGTHGLYVGGKYRADKGDQGDAQVMGIERIQVLNTFYGDPEVTDGTVYFQVLEGKIDLSGDQGSGFDVITNPQEEPGLGAGIRLVSVGEVSLPSFASDLYESIQPSLSNLLETSIPGSGRLNGMFVHKDNLYVARDTPREWIVEFQSAGTAFEDFLESSQPITGIYDSAYRPGPGVPIDQTVLSGRVLAYHVTNGSFATSNAEGFVKILEYSYDASNIDPPKFLSFYEVENWSGGELIPAGGGSSTIANVVDDGTGDNYAIYPHNEAGSSLFTTSDSTTPQGEITWEEVDLGKEVDFYEGGVRPSTALSLDLTEEIESENRRVVEGPCTESDGGTSGPGSPLTPGFRYAWNNAGNALVDDSSTANGSVVVPSAATSTAWVGTERLRLTAPGFIIDRNTAITGVSVEVRHLQTTALAGTESRLSYARLVGAGASAIRNDQTLLTGSAATVTLGGEDDGWGNASFDRETIASEGFGVDLRYQARKTSGGQTTVGVGVEYVKMTIHFVDGTERVFFWDGTNDIAEAKLVSWFRREGLWTDTTAEGVMTLYGLDVYEETGTTPPPGSAVPPEANGTDLKEVNSLAAMPTTDVNTSLVNTGNVVELEIRNAPNGSGAVLAKTTGEVSEVYLPSGQDMINERSLMQTITANFFFNKNGEATYGVTGAGPAFLYNGKYFVNIRLPVPAELDRPRHIAEHSKHLVLASKTGELFVSVVGEPTNFGGLDGASSFGFGDTITGLTGLYGNGLGVFCKGSLHALIGNSILSFTTQVISKSTGALEYTVTNMGQPIYCDERGIATITASQNYGDFDWGRISRFVSPWLQDRLKASYGAESSDKNISGVLPVRSSGQYKMFFNDGMILTLTLNADGAGTPEFTLQNYRDCSCGAIDTQLGNPLVPTALVSDITDSGEEIVAWGDSNCDIFVLQEDLTGVWTYDQIINYECYLTLNPIDANLPELSLRYNEVIIHGMVPGKKTLTFSSGTNYLLPEDTTTEITRTYGRTANSVSTTLIPDKVHAHLPNVTDGFSLKVASVGNGEPCHYLQAVTYRVGSGTDKDRTPRKR